MIKPEDLRRFVFLEEDEEKYKPLHSHVENFNRRSADKPLDKNLVKKSVFREPALLKNDDSNVPFTAGYREDLEKLFKSKNILTQQKEHFIFNCKKL